METHPVTIILGIIGGIILLALVSLGFSCTLYRFYPNEYEYLKPFYEYSKSKRIC